MDTAAIKALAKAQTEMGKALKNAQNPHLKSKYADLGSVMDACFDALHSNGFAVMQPCGADEFGQYVETVFAHETGEAFRSRVYLVIGKNDMQGVGSAITYARRYGLLGMAGLAPEDDDGEATKAKPKPVTDRANAAEFDGVAEGEKLKGFIKAAGTMGKLAEIWKSYAGMLKRLETEAPAVFAEVTAYKDIRKQQLDPAMQAPAEGEG